MGNYVYSMAYGTPENPVVEYARLIPGTEEPGFSA
jgi:hypothetical protein